MPYDPKAMKVRVESSRHVKPSYQGHPPPTTLRVPLSVFDNVTYNTHIAVIYAFRPPTPSNSLVEKGLSRVLSEYREWAGRLGKDPNGNPVILLNDEGVRFVEASVDTTLDKALPFKPSAALLSFHPSLYGVAELVQVQLTRFTCGSLMVGFTAHHLVADGHATSNFLVAWGLSARSLAIDPLPLHDRATFFVPRSPPRLEFNHRGVEFATKNMFDKGKDDPLKDDIIVHKVHFTKEFLAKLKAKASLGSKSIRPYSTFESLVAHLWRAVTTARGLDGGETTHVRISVNGRGRLSPPVPNEYFGNLVLWAFPRAKVAELIRKPLQFAAELIHDEVTKVNDGYFRSFIDFASSGVVESENLVPTADMGKSVLYPNLEVDSWLRFPFYDLDFGGGSPYYFMPSYFPVEGMLFILPSLVGDGSIDAVVPLFCHSVESFKHNCYSLA